MASAIRKRVAIVGAGVGGLTAIRHTLLYGCEPVCYEAQDNFAGIWRYKEKSSDQYGSVMESTVMNSSKEMNAFTDFPPRAEYANFMPHVEYLRYLEEYTQHYDLLRHVRYQTKVLNIKRTSDFRDNGKWELHIQNRDGSIVSEVFDGVVVSNGHFSRPMYPDPATGQEAFEGTITHGHYYKNSIGRENKVIVVVGTGNSGGDVASELARPAKQVYLCTRRGAYIVARCAYRGYPFDFVMFQRYKVYLKSFLPKWLRIYLREQELNDNFDHELYGLKPKHNISESLQSVNDDLPSRIIAGQVKVRPIIKEFTRTGVIFADGSKVDHVDEVIYCTGYHFELKLIEEGNLVKGPLPSMMEAQVRLALEVMLGGTRLPPMAERRRQVEATANERKQALVDSARNTILIDGYVYVETLTKMTGTSPPSFKDLLFSDPLLAYHVYFGPRTPYQFRLRGPHPWSGARDAILDQERRIAQGYNYKLTSLPTNPATRDTIVVVTLVCLLAWLLMKLL